jgi:hypothetical protein
MLCLHNASGDTMMHMRRAAHLAVYEHGIMMSNGAGVAAAVANFSLSSHQRVTWQVVV